MKQAVHLLILFSLCGTALGQIGCPAALGWVSNGLMCYKFSNFPQLKYQDAVANCQTQGATLVSANSEGEHRFIKDWLLANDQRRDTWWTSGRTAKNGDVHWEGDGTKAIYTSGWIIPTSEYDSEHNIVYKFNGAEFGWSVSEYHSILSYICEIGVQEVYRISQEHRGFDYGLNILNPSEAPRGPKFLVEPQSVTILRQTPLVYFDCAADGNPGVTYQWLRQNQDRVMVPLQLNDRYTTVTGRLNIINPSSKTKDQGTFQCKVTNKFGTILSNPVTLRFGNIDDFPTVASDDVYVSEHMGAQLVCPAIQGNPGLVYQWYKNSPNSFIRPSFQTHSFISSSGKLLFSEVSKSDAGEYFCMASLTAFGLSRNYVGSSQPNSKLSKGFKLEVGTSSGNLFHVDIQSGFIFIYPSIPVRGGTLMMECFAYGSLPLRYSWGRKNGKLPEGRHRFKSANRILILDNIDLSDEDIYFCNVSSSRTNTKESTTLALSIWGKPFFVYPLQHQHVDVGSRLTWHCEAMGRPFPAYTWYKNGKVLTSSSGVTVRGNTLTIQSLDPARDNAMYQCGAKNDQGESFSTAQLRVLQIEPSFEKNPMIKLLTAAIGGNVTIQCDPIGAPRPTFTWYKDNSPISVVAGLYQPGDHHWLLLSGDLRIMNINQGDVGRYKCSVENGGGSAEDFTDLQVSESVQFYQRPQDDVVEVNLTITLMCQASHSTDMDMVYQWFFNDHVIDFEREPEYRLGYGKEEGYLYITSVQFRNQGRYTCGLVSSSDRQQASCYLRVNGPPGEPGGVRVHEQPIDGDNSKQLEGIKMATTRWLTWVDGDPHGDPITHFFIQFKTEFSEDWSVHADGDNIPQGITELESNPDIRSIRVTNLKAGAGIQFRVIARNAYGLGLPSLATKMVTIDGAPPSQLVTNVRGGGGSNGDLSIWWDPLPKEDHNGPNLHYQVYWRLYEENGRGDKWQKANISHSKACQVEINIEMGALTVCQFVKLVGRVNYYTRYEVKIQAVNKDGGGPSTEPTIIMSAETLPQASPSKVYAIEYNSTALMVHWSPIRNVRESAGGTLKGYKINYWRYEIDEETDALQNIIELKKGQTNLNRGLIIGLKPMTWYNFNIQAYNSAGNGYKSPTNRQETLNNVPKKFPTEVYVYSIEGKGVQVRFRGISTQAAEEPLQGYKVQIWKSNENIRSAVEYDLGKRNSGVIKSLNSSVLYQLRVFAYSRAGQGMRSSPTVLFTVGDGQILSNPETTEIMSGSSTVYPSFVFSFFLVVITILIHQKHC